MEFSFTAPNHSERRFFGSHGMARDTINHALQPASLVRIAVAYFEASGYQCLQDALSGKQVKLLVGRPKGGRDRLEEVITEFADTVTSPPLQRRTRSLRLMLEALQSGLLAVAVGDDVEAVAFLDARYLYHHAKLYIADNASAVVTSANLSYPGLVTSREAGFCVDTFDDVSYFVSKFDEYFEQADSITKALVHHLLNILGQRTPYEVYIRALLELYGLPEDDVPPQLPMLAGYQRPIVSRVLQNIIDHQGAMLVASTGLGKTVMAAHIVAYLRMQDRINKVIVVCPAGIRENWRRFMRAALVPSVEFSYHTLSGDDPRRDSQVRNFQYELRHVDERTLVVLDESHHMRNADVSAGERRLRYQRMEDAIHQMGAQLLMLTATPYSRGVDDVNAQLALLPRSNLASKHMLLEGPMLWRVDAPAELPELPPCAVLTTPSVVNYFSDQDANGERYVLFSGNAARYFPRRLHILTETYDNPLDDILVELLRSQLLNKKVQEMQPGLFGDEILSQTAGTFNAEVMRQFCSSPVQVEDLFSKLSEEGGFEKMRFAHQAELTRFTERHLLDVRRFQHPAYDQKLERVIDIVASAGDEKVVIFCHYIETAKALTEIINTTLVDHGIQAETTADRDPDTVENVIRTFAPIANEVEEEERNGGPIHVLVATGALAEGFNLQDASILINYDLPWTVLILAQRMGRILRPWYQPREITIYNFVPSTMSDPRIHMAMNWQKRLMERSKQHRSFADIPVMLEDNQQVGEEGLEMAALARTMQDFGNVSLTLEQQLEFTEKAEKLQTSSFLNDLAILTADDRESVLGLPPGFRSALMYDGETQLFLLLQYRRRTYATLFDRQGNVIFDNELKDRIMKTIRCRRDEPCAPASLYPKDDDFDHWIDTCRESWCLTRGYSPELVNYVCALALISKSQ